MIPTHMQAVLHILLPGHQDLAAVQTLSSTFGGVFGGGGDGDGGVLLLQASGAPGTPVQAAVNGLSGSAGGGGGGAGEAAVQPVKEAAVVSALRVLTAALRMDSAFLSSLARAHGHDRYPPITGGIAWFCESSVVWVVAQPTASYSP